MTTQRKPIMMQNVSEYFRHVRELVAILLSLTADAVCYLRLCLLPSPILAAEHLFLRQPLGRFAALYTRCPIIFVWRDAPFLVVCITNIDLKNELPDFSCRRGSKGEVDYGPSRRSHL